MAELVAVRGQALKRYAFLLCGDDEAADDLVQEAMVRALSRRVPDDLRELERYVRRVLLNIVVDDARRAVRWRRLLPRIALRGEARDRSGEVVDRVSLEEALAVLPMRQRACVVLHYYEDLPVAEVADLLGCTPGTVKSQLHDARKTLARTWDDAEQQPVGTKGEA
ncbi:sigma-70 family RNA polymerase sigma factor [Yinghuangia soli]|uniref:Sigma-70 family RNA polymerase sigma factor n=1 Tax=Yinghuangia soli TaxID=2908204 RepID=A0AA41U4K5_9ACTN|nr:sigma-70 family RNA polymerase sigma factor [Yinghuangia soli]MCF2533026.1 sigma-70 family RNA polymerase sigma factor [Yinghuangia soli]